MEAFTQFKAIAMPVDIANCDTDQIIPARFLRLLPEDEPNFARVFFHDLRFDDDGNEVSDFIFNKEPFRSAKIVVADINWGCGSSRENAVYALVSNGIRSVIAPSFGDIHYNNCMKHGVLPVRLAREVCDDLREQLHANPGAEIAVDLDSQTVRAPNGDVHQFEIDGFDKYRMLNGLDDVGVTRSYGSEFDAFEARHQQEYDWLSWR